MNWLSASDFFYMGGYGLYVWGSFGISALAMLLEPLLIRQRLSTTTQRLHRQTLAEQLNKESN